MENDKLKKLTDTLYEEGLAKGRAEGERIVADAEARARKIVADAEDEARRIAAKAKAAAEELRSNTLTEISLAGREAVSHIKEQITSLIVARSIKEGVHQAAIDPEFIKELLLNVSKSWGGTSTGKVTLAALLPESRRKELDAAFNQSTAELLAAGIEVGYSKDVRTGFRVGEKNGGYYLDFSDESLQALLGRYLRDRAAKILYGTK